MHDVSGAQNVGGASLVSDHERAMVVETSRSADDAVAARQLRSHVSSKGRGVAAELVEHALRVAPAIVECRQQIGQQRVPVGVAATLGDRRRRRVSFSCGEVDTDPDDHAGHRTGDELRKHSRQLAGGRAFQNNNVVGPLRARGRVDAVIDHRTSSRAQGADLLRGGVVGDRNADADEQRGTRQSLPSPIESPPSCLLMIGHEDRRTVVAAAGLSGQIDVRGAG